MGRSLGDAFVTVHPDTSGFEGETSHKLGAAFKKVALVAGAGTAALGASIIKTGVAYNQLQQSSRAALTTLLGGAKAANRQMDKLDEFATTSPFAKQVFIKAQQQLLGFGLSAKRVVPTLSAIQDAVAATGGSSADIGGIANVLAKVKGAGKITADTLNQLGERGIDAAKLIGQQMGKTPAQIRELITKGTLPAGKALKALTDGMQKRFSGAAANVKNTWAGATDRISAAFRDLSSDLVEPFVGKKGGGVAIVWANKLADAIRAIPSKKIGGGIKTFIDAFSSPAATQGAANVSGLAKAGSWLGRAYDKAVPVVKQFFGNLKDNLSGFDYQSVLDKAGAGVAKLGKALADSDGPASDLADGLKVGATVVGFFADHVDLLVKAMPFLVAGFVALKVAEQAQRLASAVSIPVQIARTVAIRQQTKAMRELIAAMDAGVVSQIAQTATTGTSTAATTTNTAARQQGVLATVRQKVALVAQTVAQKVATVATKAMALAQRGLNLVMRANPIGLVITALLALAVGFKYAWDHSSKFRAIVKGAWHGIQVAASASWDFIKRVFGWLKSGVSAVGRAFGKAKDAIGDAWGKIKSLASSPIKFVVNHVVNPFLEGVGSLPGLGFLKDLEISTKGWKDGGYTGRLSARTIAGFVHGDEQVISSPSRRNIEREQPGLLDYMNERGTMRGYRRGGRVSPLNHPPPWTTYPGHTGIDFPVRTGTPVYATEAGRISQAARWNYSYGHHLRLAGRSGVTSIYAHLSRLLAHLGQGILPGQLIGLSGSTGNSTGPHLHFEVRPGGTASAAAAYLKGVAPGGSPLAGFDFAGKLKGWLSSLEGHTGIFGSGLGGFVKSVAGKLWDSIKKNAGTYGEVAGRGALSGLLPGGSPFDSGGVARGAGYLPKRTLRPERVLSPRDSVSFEELVKILRGGGGLGGPTVQVSMPASASPGEVADALLFALRRRDRGGVYV